MVTVVHADGSKTITNSIGSSGRDFTTPQAWLDSIPANLVEISTRYIGEMYNDSEFGQKIVVSNRTTSAQFNITLRPAAGHAFYDAPGASQNPVWYDQTKGVGIGYANGAYEETMLRIDAPYTVIEGLQFNGRWASSKSAAIFGTAIGAIIRRCFFKCTPAHNGWSALAVQAGRVEHCLFVYDAPYSPLAAIDIRNGAKLYNVGLVRPTNRAVMGNGFAVNYSAAELINCYAFGFTNDFTSNSGWLANTGYNASSTATNPAAGVGGIGTNLTGLVTADQFEQPNATLANPNLRLKPTSAMLDVGKNLTTILGSSADMFNIDHGDKWDIGPIDNLKQAKTTKFVSAPPQGFVNSPSAPITVGVDGFLTASVVVTPSDGVGGTFSPASVTLTPANPTAQFTYTPKTIGDKTITIVDNGGLIDATPVTYKASNAATILVWGANNPTKGRAGEALPGITVTTDGVVTQDTIITLTGAAGDVFTPETATITSTNNSVTFSYTGAAGGVKSISVSSNNVALQNPNPITITLRNPIVAKPTISTDDVIVKSIGAGKDMVNLVEFATYIQSLDLVALKQTVIGEMYENYTLPPNLVVSPKTANLQYRAILQPCPGLGVWDYEETTDKLNYGEGGIEIKGGNIARIGRGVTFRGFRVDLSGTNGLRVCSSTNSGNASLPIVERCRFKISMASGNALEAGEYNTPLEVRDCLFIRTAGDGPIVTIGTPVTLERNTVVATGTGTYSTGAFVMGGTNVGYAAVSMIRDNAFINVGSKPIVDTNLSAAGKILSNATDNAMTPTLTGVSVHLPGTLVNATDDYRPKDGGGLIGTASSAAIDVPDLRNLKRGAFPDKGAAQGTAREPLPLVSITSVLVNGQDVTVSGTALYSPLNGVATLPADPTNPDGASTLGPTAITLNGTNFSVKWEGVQAGNYGVPSVTVTNSSGYNRTQTGGEKSTIIDVVANVVEGQVQLPIGNAPSLTIENARFDHNVLSITGTIDKQGDPLASVTIFLDPQPSGNSILPTVVANVVGNRWGARFNPAPGRYRIRVVATANGKTSTLISDPRKLIKGTANITLPAPTVA